MRKRVFIAHQIGGDVEANLESATRWCRWAILKRNVNPIAPYLSLIGILDEGVEDERELGLTLAEEYIPMCEELWVCGPLPSSNSHVWREIKLAEGCEVEIIDYTDLVLPKHFHSVKSTTGPATLLVDKSNLVSLEESKASDQ